jgi:hypothetical protein
MNYKIKAKRKKERGFMSTITQTKQRKSAQGMFFGLFDK